MIMIGMNITSFFEAQNVSPTDIPIFLLVHTTLSAILVSFTWFLCYQTMSTHTVPSWNRPTSFVTNHPFVQKQTMRWSRQIEVSTKSSETMQRILGKFPTMDPARLAASLVEAKIARLLVKPVTIPGRIWLSLKVTQGFHRFHREQQFLKNNESTFDKENND